MKKFYSFFAAVILLFVSTSSFAQFVGGNGKGYRVTSDSFSTFWLGYAPTSWKVGDTSESGYNTFSLGITHMSSLSGSPVFLEYGAYVDWMNKTKSKRTYNFLDIKVPVNLMYPLAIADGITFFPYVGLNVRGYVLGNNTYRSGDFSETFEYFGESNYYNRFGLGYQVGLCASFSTIMARIGYEDMFTSIHKDTIQKINYLTLGIGIPF